MNTPKWAEQSNKLANDPDPKVRRRACKKLARTHDPAVIPHLSQAYLSDTDPDVKDAAREGLARFKAQQMGTSTRRLPVSDRALSIILGVLVLTFAGLLVVNVLPLLAGDDNQDRTTEQPATIFNPTDRTVLHAQIEQGLAASQSLSADLRGMIAGYNATGQLTCDAINTYELPPLLAFSEMDRKTYPDLKIISEKYNAALNPLQVALLLLTNACANPDLQTANILEASSRLDQADAQLQEVSDLLQQAITSPAATVGPTPTPLPTATPTPTITLTPTVTPSPVPATATQPVMATMPPTTTPGPTETPTVTPSPTETPTLTPTLPLPALDYQQILRDLSSRTIILGDLKNNFGTGMINVWEQAQAGETVSDSRCQLQEWPQIYDLTDAQRAQLNTEGVADPLLEEALQLQIAALELAYQARVNLYVPNCPDTLATTAGEGIALAQEAYDKLSRMQDLVAEMRSRPTE